jgi:hypothetical protein
LVEESGNNLIQTPPPPLPVGVSQSTKEGIEEIINILFDFWGMSSCDRSRDHHRFIVCTIIFHIKTNHNI